MKKIVRVGINGFGRIGRNAARIILNRQDIKLVAVNSRSDVKSHAYLLKYDSTYGTFEKEINISNEYLVVGKEKIRIYNYDLPKDIPWEKEKVDIVIDATGKFTKTPDLEGHLSRGVKYVVLSSPAKDNTKTLVMGVNQEEFNPKIDRIISNSSCTTNCLATTIKVLEKTFGIKRAFMTTIHAVTDTQNLLDNSHKKEVRLRRASFLSMIPSSTGSAKDIGKLYPGLSGKIICQAIRVPLATVSMILLTAEVKKKTTEIDVNNAFVTSSKKDLKGILSVSEDELVSKDYCGNPYSSVVDTYLTKILDDSMVSVSAWYDNEWGYTSRLVDMAEFIAEKAKII